MEDETTEIYSAYDSGISLPVGPYCDKICDDPDGFQIFLREGGKDKPIYKVIFQQPVLAYRNSDEGKRLKSLHLVQGKIATCIFTVGNSQFLKWFNEESLGIYSDLNIKHFAILTQEDFLDVLDTDNPAIHIIE